MLSFHSRKEMILNNLFRFDCAALNWHQTVIHHRVRSINLIYFSTELTTIENKKRKINQNHYSLIDQNWIFRLLLTSKCSTQLCVDFMTDIVYLPFVANVADVFEKKLEVSSSQIFMKNELSTHRSWISQFNYTAATNEFIVRRRFFTQMNRCELNWIQC